MAENFLEAHVAVIGAGPAGAAISIFLSKAGIKHVVIEKENFPRDKVCGDAISGKAAFVLRKADPSWLQEIFTTEKTYLPSYGIRFFGADGKFLNIPYSPAKFEGEKAPGFTAKRIHFDQFLFEKIHSKFSTIFQGCSSLHFSKKEDKKIHVGFESKGVQFSLKCNIVVGADGEKSQVSKFFLKGKHQPKANCVALRSYLADQNILTENPFIEIHYLPEITPGYFWIFPLADGLANVGAGMLSKHIRKNKINLRERMKEAMLSHTHILKRFPENVVNHAKIEGWGLPMFDGKRKISGENFLLTGDAAGLVDPFSGEGIGNALYSGMLAAESIEKSLKENKPGAYFFYKNYQQPLYKKLGPELRKNLILQRLAAHQRLISFVLKKAHRSKTLHDAICQMFTGNNLNSQLINPLFYLRIIFNR